MIRKGWTVYAVALTAIIVAGEVTNLMHGALDFRTLANWVVTCVLLLATWAYALRRRIGSQYYWRRAWWVLAGATLVTAIPAVLAGPEARAWVAVLLPLVLPALYASFRYAYRSPEVWR